jgi:cytochrome c oxidase subunit 1
MFAGIYHWFPRMSEECLTKHGICTLWVTAAICAYGVFFPMHFIGLAGYRDVIIQTLTFLYLTIYKM